MAKQQLTFSFFRACSKEKWKIFNCNNFIVVLCFGFFLFYLHFLLLHFLASPRRQTAINDIYVKFKQCQGTLNAVYSHCQQMQLQQSVGERWLNRGMSNNVPLEVFFFYYLVFHLLWPASGDCVDLFCAALRWLFISQETQTTTEVTTKLQSASWDGQTMANMPQSTLHKETEPTTVSQLRFPIPSQR